ncbi:MAG TPA: ATP-binding protein [Hyphomonadaceae bacterium]|jgi:two-component system phosphate regulon sensor histidine kinase PhoR|nr:ATP-binding protein [Hyphomonadaceae bacterium]
MPDPNTPSKEDDAPTGAFTRVTRSRRASDFLVLGIAGLIVIGGMALLGEITVWAAAFAVMIMAAFSIAYFAGTAEVSGEEGRREEAADEEEVRRRQAERTLRASFINALPEAAMYIDAQGKVEAANQAARKQFRFVGADPVLSAVVRRPELLDAVSDARTTGEAQKFEFVERDETDRYFTCVAAPLGTGVLVSMHDLTEIKRAEFARVDFLANASHELRTPLTSLAGFIETLRGPAKDDEKARERFLDIMHGQAERMRRLISDLLSLSRIELAEHRLPEGEADLANVVSEAGDALLPVAKARDVKLRVMGPSSSVVVTGVRDELAQVVQNLIDNAIKYSEAGGVVEIEVLTGLSREQAASQAGRRWPTAGHMSIATAPAAPASSRYALLRVTDAGPGIERQYLPRLSERFYRVDPGRGLRPGTGLGLAIVKHVVQRHRGEFLVESEPGRGSAFGVILPLAAPAAALAPSQYRKVSEAE